MKNPLSFSMCLLGVLCAACAHTAPGVPAVYSPAPTRADAAGPTVPPVYVHLAASKYAVLERETDADWTDVCVAPCDGYVPAFGTYRVSLSFDKTSLPFTLPGPPGTRVALKVDDDCVVWTRDSVQLAAQRAQGAAAGATWLSLARFLRP